MRGKQKRQRLNGGSHHGHTNNPSRGPHNAQSQSRPPAAKVRAANPLTAATAAAAAKGKILRGAQQQQQHSAAAPPVIPFSADDRILLVGEADLSFARSLIEHHSCARVTATVLEKNRKELEGKYPHAVENIAAVEKSGGKVVYSVDAMRMGQWTEGGKSVGSLRVGAMDRVIFNFPHVGGKSTDVNRQVRYNQELLVSFFNKVMPSVALGGSIIVTLFEGEPYTLWNIRDLARHSGLQVERSFRFQASAYPGYRHSRTFGVVNSKRGQSGAGWKGEDRLARSYVFIRKGEEPRNLTSSCKRKRGENTSDEDDD